MCAFSLIINSWLFAIFLSFLLQREKVFEQIMVIEKGAGDLGFVCCIFFFKHQFRNGQTEKGLAGLLQAKEAINACCVF